MKWFFSQKFFINKKNKFTLHSCLIFFHFISHRLGEYFFSSSDTVDDASRQSIALLIRLPPRLSTNSFSSLLRPFKKESNDTVASTFHLNGGSICSLEDSVVMFNSDEKKKS